MPSMRVQGSWPIVFTILLLFFVSAVHSANNTAPYPANPANSTAPHPAKGTAPSCNAKLKSTLKITEIANPHRVRRDDKPLGGNQGHIAPRCSVKTNSTIKITEIPDPHLVRREEKPPGGTPGKLAPRCKAKFNSTVSAGNAANATAIKVGRIRRADKPPGGASLSSGSGRASPGHASEGSGGGGGEGYDEGEYPDDSSPPPPLEAVDLASYMQKGELSAAYMWASDEEVAADLVRKRKLNPGQQIASPFTDHSALRSNGWEESDVVDEIQGVEFAHHVPFINALQSLGISTQAQPKGNHQNTVYEHRLLWMRNGQRMQPAGKQANFQYVTSAEDACIVMTMMYSIQHIIKERRLVGIESPPLSRASDMAFLEWQRACAKSKTDIKSLSHIFIHVVVTRDTQNVVASILHKMGKSITDRADVWGNQVPRWEQKLTFLPNSNDGKALLGTVQLRGIMWMLLQHREHLGRKAVKSISLFRGVYPGTGSDVYPELFGPDFYIELEDVQPGAGASRSGASGGGPSGSGKSKSGQSGSGSGKSGAVQSGSKQSGSKQS